MDTSFFTGYGTPTVFAVDASVYIDPNNSNAGRNGSFSNPYNSFVESGTLKSNTVYKVKSGTELVTATTVNLSGLSSTVIEPYGIGALPKIKFTGNQFCAVRMGNCINCTLDGFELYTDLSNAVLTLIALSTNSGSDGGTGNTIKYCNIHHVKYGNDGNNGMGIRGGGNNLSILNTIISDIGVDGMYLRDTNNLTVDFCSVSRVNQNYAGASVGFLSVGTAASGDGIQLDGYWNNCYLGHTSIDRADLYTGYKFPLVLGGANTWVTSSAIVEYCVITTRNDTGISYSIYQGMGNGVIYRYNTFNGKSAGIRVSGVYCVNTLIHNNTFNGCAWGIGVVYLTDPNYLGSPVNTQIFNNTFYNSGSSDISLTKSDAISRNNIHYHGPGSSVAVTRNTSGNLTQSNNCYQDNTHNGDYPQAVNSVVGKPDFVNPEAGNFHLLAGSICVNAGVNVGITKDADGTLIPQGVSPDIGAFEFHT